MKTWATHIYKGEEVEAHLITRKIAPSNYDIFQFECDDGRIYSPLTAMVENDDAYSVGHYFVQYHASQDWRAEFVVRHVFEAEAEAV